MGNASSIIKFCRKRKKIIISIPIFLILLLLYKSDRVMIETPQRISQNINQKIGADLFPMWSKLTNYAFRLEDDLNPFRMKKSLLDGTLPIYDLELAPKDLIHFDEVSKEAIRQGTMPQDKNDWRNAKLTIDGKRYDIKVKFHGDHPTQWSDELKSYQIKSDKDEYISNMRRFNLIIFEDRLLRSSLTRSLAKSFGLFDIKDDIIVLKINGVIQGIYYMQERLDINFLESDGNRCSGCYIIKNTDNWIEDHPYDISPGSVPSEDGIMGADHITAFDYEISNIDDQEAVNFTEVLYPTYKIFEAVKNSDPGVINYFDIDYLSSFEAMRMVIGSPHLIAGDNLQMAYSSTNSKFYPIPINEGLDRLRLENGGLEHSLNTYRKPIQLFSLLARNDELRHIRNKKVYSFIQDSSITAEYEKMLEKYEPYALSYKTNSYNSRILRHTLADFRSILQHNMDTIKRNLEYSKVYINAVEKGNRVSVEVVPDSIAETKFGKAMVSLKETYSGDITVTADMPEGKVTRTKNVQSSRAIELKELLEGLYFSAGLDENLYPSVRRYVIELEFKDAGKISLESLNITMKNDISGREIADSDTYIKISDGNDYYSGGKYKPIGTFIAEHPELKFEYSGGELRLLRGDYTVDDDIMIPKSKKFVIEAGTSLRINPGKSVLSYSPLSVEGTKEDPVIITAFDKNQPFGTFAVVGDGNPEEKAYINWLDLSYGSDKWINGMWFIGQLAIHHTPFVYINNTQIHGSYSDDGINIKYANVLIENSRFYGNYADQIDIDYSTGIVKNSEFDGKGDHPDSNGDGLDLSGSKMLVKYSTFRNLGDKGISIGEETQVVAYRNTLKDNNMGTAVKDMSKAYFIDNTFTDNNIAIAAYEKKQLFGGGTAYVYQNSFSLNDVDFDQDAKSKIYRTDASAEYYKKLRENAELETMEFPE